MDRSLPARKCLVGARAHLRPCPDPGGQPLGTLTAHQRLKIAAEIRGMTDRQATEHRRELMRLFYQSSRG
jgi:hypothetical protein